MLDIIQAVDSMATILADGFYRSNGMPELVTAFFDESGKLADTEVVAFGGIVAPQSKMLAFANEWDRALRENGLTYFSMKEAMHYQGPFSTWKGRERERNELLKRLLSLTGMTNRVFCGVTSAEFKALPPERGSELVDPTYMCFEACIKLTVIQNPQVAIAVTYDLSEQYAERCLALYHKLRRQHPQVKQQCFAIHFADDECLPQLQAADLVAGIHRTAKTGDDKHPILSELDAM